MAHASAAIPRHPGLCPGRYLSACEDGDLGRGNHQGQRSLAPRKQAGHKTASDKWPITSKSLALQEPSTQDEADLGEKPCHRMAGDWRSDTRAGALYGDSHIFCLRSSLAAPNRLAAGRPCGGTAAFGLDSVPWNSEQPTSGKDSQSACSPQRRSGFMRSQILLSQHAQRRCRCRETGLNRISHDRPVTSTSDN